MAPGKAYRFGEFLLRPATRQFLRKGEALAVPVLLFDCLVYLIENRTRAVGRDELSSAVWGRTDVSEAQLTQTILRARRLLNEESGATSCIRTIPKFGYHWVGDVQVDTDVEPSAPTPPSSALVENEEPSPANTPRQWQWQWRRWLGWMAIIAAAAGIGLAWMHAAPQPQVAADKVRAGILVLPLDVASNDDAAWVRLGAMDVVAERLRGAGVAVPPSEDTLALMRANGSSKEPADFLRRTGVAWVISGRAERSPNGWRVHLDATSAAGIGYEASNEEDEVLPALRASTDALLGQLGIKSADSPSGDEALEETIQRAQAAMLANDLSTAQRILTQAPARVSEQPELRYQVAVLAFRAGRLGDAENEWQGLLSDESTANKPYLRARVHYGIGAVAMMRDDANKAEQSFDTALKLLAGRENLLEYGKALGGRGGARFTLGRAQEGMDDMSRARIVLEQAGDRLALARLNVSYGIAATARGRPRAAIPVLIDALTALQPFGAVNERAHAYSALVNAHLALLDHPKAAAANDAARALLPLIGDPLNRAETLIDRTAILLSEGRIDEAALQFAELDALDLTPFASLDGRRLEMHVRWSWSRGDAQATSDRATLAIDRLAAVDAATAGEMVLIRQRALLALGRTEDAQVALRGLPAALSAPRPGSVPLGVQLARAELAAAQGDASAADSAFAAAASEVDADDVPARALLLAASHVPVLLAQERWDAASALVGRLPEAADRDFEGALIRVRLYHTLGRNPQWADALQRAQALAGQRPIPALLLVPPLARPLPRGS
ncbi:DNA-binding winged helix-turn-helix (wHTH) protein [Tahibacter aquaticus]|uniref:DNA-binding winged helix-turn-helix (WHTH) protein n=1 Tax=Tahibacter aquaticus TaxID=520092 RepID=A0A4R6Z530_9GAMM|nr:winged helix-turn-helix domain-containing protein [Tahibacter aquaticus]TDR46807.1 DNA-binding winged helix-turn-helix (wHTH) protein [Tahibacter aquaticus]